MDASSLDLSKYKASTLGRPTPPYRIAEAQTDGKTFQLFRINAARPGDTVTNLLF
jgi:hypothetical protein